jgi:hypothetical protein
MRDLPPFGVCEGFWLLKTAAVSAGEKPTDLAAACQSTPFVSRMLAASKGRGRYGSVAEICGKSNSSIREPLGRSRRGVCQTLLWQGHLLDRQKPLDPPLKSRWREEPISHPSHTLHYEPFQNAVRNAPWAKWVALRSQ